MIGVLIATVQQLLPIILPVLVCAGLGFSWARLGKPFNDEFVTSLSTNIAAPCLIFGTLAKLQISPDAFAKMALVAAVSYAVFGLLGWLALKPTGYSVRTYLPSIMFGNIGNMGLPLCLFAFGDVGLSLALAVFTVGAVIMFIVCPWVASGHTSPQKLLKTPLLYSVALAVGFMMLGVTPPKWLSNTTDLIGGMMIPLMLLALGHSLARLKVASLGRSVMLSLLRLVMGLFVGVVLSEIFDLQGAERGVLILQSALPVAVFNYLFAARYNRDPEEVASIVVISTLISLVTLPFLLLLVLSTGDGVTPAGG